MADERDSRVSQRYRQLGAQEPSPEVDRSILAAARDAVERPHAPLVTPAGRHRWYFSLAAAAVVVLAVAVTLHVEQQQRDAEVAPPPIASTPPVEDKLQPPASAAQDQRSASPAPQEAKPGRRATPQPPPVFAPDPSAPREPSAPELRKEQSEAFSAEREPHTGPQQRREAPTAQAVPEAPRPEPRARADVSGDRSPGAARAPMANFATETPERWLERIAQLRREGRNEDADRELAEFRKRYPDYRIREDMQRKVERP